VSTVGSFFSYVNDARSHEPHIYVFNPSVTLQLCRHLDSFSN